MIVTNASGCSDTASLTVYVPKVASPGVVAANAADLVLCPGDNIAFDIASTNSGTLDAIVPQQVLFLPTSGNSKY